MRTTKDKKSKKAANPIPVVLWRPGQHLLHAFILPYELIVSMKISVDRWQPDWRA